MRQLFKKKLMQEIEKEAARQDTEGQRPGQYLNEHEWEKSLLKSHDFKKTFYVNQKSGKKFCFSFITTLVDESILQNNALPYLLEGDFTEIEDVKSWFPLLMSRFQTKMRILKQNSLMDTFSSRLRMKRNTLPLLPPKKRLSETLRSLK